MANIQRRLDDRLTAAIRGLFPEAADAPAIVMQAQDERFGDYQANGAMALAKRLGKNPRDVAAEIVAAADLSGIAENVEIAGPGFINITLSPDWLAAQLAEVLADERLGVPSPAQRQTIVVDYSAPNLAKEMHVGHLRSTIIGDALVRVLDFLGHTVVRQNHMGDWGTQIGMLIEHLADDRHVWDAVLDLPMRGERCIPRSLLPDLEVFYREAKQRFDSDARFAQRARMRVVDFQTPGGSESREVWKRIRQTSLAHAQEVYERLGVRLKPEDVRGESAYENALFDVIVALMSAMENGPSKYTESEGAQCVFLNDAEGKPRFVSKEGDPLPLIVQKSDEGYLYATTDLAAIAFRTGFFKELASGPDGSPEAQSPQADQILYVVDARQSLHFRMVFECAYQAEFADRDKHDLKHVDFGMMLGSDNRPFKTREGGTVKLMDLIDEAEGRAFDLVTEKNPDLPEDDRRRIAHVVGIGALKYADLAQNRTKDYVFSWDKMLSLDGNTAPYMQYAFARIHSIARKGGLDLADLVRHPAADEGFALAEPAERRLAVALLQFAETVETVAADCLPHVLCGYLYRLAGAFMGFYETCPVLKSEKAVRASRLRLCGLTAKVIEKGLNLLGIETAKRM